jgi:hypothetical protein
MWPLRKDQEPDQERVLRQLELRLRAYVPALFLRSEQVQPESPPLDVSTDRSKSNYQMHELFLGGSEEVVG